MSTTEETTATPETPPPPAAKIAYHLDPHSRITRTAPGEKPMVIAALIDNKVHFAHEDFQKYKAQIAGLLHQKGHKDVAFEPYHSRPPVTRDAVLVSQAAFNPAGPASPMTPPPPPDEADGVDGMKGLTVEQRKAVNHLRAKEGFPLGELERNAPPAPRLSSGAGDKTPSYVRWLLRYFPQKFVEKYGVTGMGKIEVVVPGKIDPITHKKGPARRVWEDGHVLARRKTILTEIAVTQPEADEGGGE